MHSKASRVFFRQCFAFGYFLFHEFWALKQAVLPSLVVFGGATCFAESRGHSSQILCKLSVSFSSLSDPLSCMEQKGPLVSAHEAQLAPEWGTTEGAEMLMFWRRCWQSVWHVLQSLPMSSMFFSLASISASTVICSVYHFCTRFSTGGGSNFKILLFSPDFWFRFPFYDSYILQIGWFNHQLLVVVVGPWMRVKIPKTQKISRKFNLQDPKEVTIPMVFLFKFELMDKNQPCCGRTKSMWCAERSI